MPKAQQTYSVFFRYLAMLVMAWGFGLVLTLFLFLRPTPYGPDYVIDIWHYLPHAIFYMTFGLMLIAAPFMLFSILLKDKEKHHRLHLIGEIACALLLALSLLYQHIDNEIMRFCSMHITPDFLRTYVLSQGVPDPLWDLLATDAGGSNLSLYLLSIPAIFLIIWFVLGRRIPQPPLFEKKYITWGTFAALIISFIFLPCLFRTDLFGSKNRQGKVAPPAVLIRDAIASWNDEHHFPKDMPERIRTAQEMWLAQENDKNWQMVDDKHPWLRKYHGQCAPVDKPYNVIIISFESYRAYNLNLFNPEFKQAVTPYLNSLIQSGHAAYYTHYYTNGHPTIGAFMSLHTGIPPHSSRTVAKAFTRDTIDAFPNVLRKHGYQAVFVGGSDPDWDNQRPWLMRWYDEVLFNPDNNEQDRLVMHDALNWIQNRDKSKPFIMTAFLISNHMPFHLPEEDMQLTDSDILYEKIINTMHYDDDVLKEFVESIKSEPWFDDTILIITGDHGLDLGDRGDAPDYNNLRTEAVWIPLVIYGKNPRIPTGKQEIPGSHNDMGMTVLDLLGICDDTSSMGHSLLSKNKDAAEIYIYKDGRASIRNNQWSAYILIDDDNKVMLYKGDDHLQKTDLASEYPDIADQLRQRSKDISIVVDYGYQKNLFF